MQTKKNRTPPLEVTDRTLQPCYALHRFLAPEATEFIFGDRELQSCTPVNAAKMSARRQVPAISVYIAAGLPEDADEIKFLFQDVPSRLLRVSSVDFLPLPSWEDNEEEWLIRQVVPLYGAMAKHSTPVLLINSNYLIMYNSVGRDGRVIYGGVSQGINAKFQSLKDYDTNERFPTISYEKFKETISDCMAGRAPPLKAWSNNPVRSMIGSNLCDLATSLLYRVQKFIDDIKKADASNNDNNNNNIPTVVMTGRDTFLTEKLLKPNHSGILDWGTPDEFPKENEVKLLVENILAPYAVEHLLQSMTEKKRRGEEATTQNPIDDLRTRITGLRGGKAMNLESTTGVFRFTVLRVQADDEKLDNDTFEIMFDSNGKKDSLSLLELYGTFSSNYCRRLYYSNMVPSCPAHKLVSNYSLSLHVDALVFYSEVGEEEKGENESDWAKAKREAMISVLADLVKHSSEISSRKDQLDAVRQKEGSLSSLLGQPAPAEKRGKKRGRPSIDDPDQFLDKRIAKWFEEDDPDNPGKIVNKLYFGTVDYVVRDEEEILWHIMYDDDDQEDFDIRQVRQGLKEYEEHKNEDLNPKTDKAMMMVQRRLLRMKLVEKVQKEWNRSRNQIQLLLSIT